MEKLPFLNSSGNVSTLTLYSGSWSSAMLPPMMSHTFLPSSSLQITCNFSILSWISLSGMEQDKIAESPTQPSTFTLTGSEKAPEIYSRNTEMMMMKHQLWWRAVLDWWRWNTSFLILQLIWNWKWCLFCGSFKCNCNPVHVVLYLRQNLAWHYLPGCSLPTKQNNNSDKNCEIYSLPWANSLF